MKVRDSGMPKEDMWNTFFDPKMIFDSLELEDPQGIVVDFGSGYGTFLLPAAVHFGKSKIIGLDIESELNSAVTKQLSELGYHNAMVITRDFIVDGTGLDSNSVNTVLLFNILHAENPVSLLREAHRILIPGGIAAIIHWNYDSATPRGPSMDIRPKPESTLSWASSAGFQVPNSVKSVAQYHYGFLATKEGE
ncbi:MAG: class I SAM-dependent methyltransferase [Fibrobacteres bacterium]|nr:class I SAM-dependent methyltransferase [Fibrobacterota bacterium]